jgi:NAD+ diphosphatase
MKTILYTGLSFDRAHHLRPSAANLLPFAAVVPVWRELSLLAGEAAGLITGDAAARLLAQAPEAVFLGMDGDRPMFAADISAVEAPDFGPDTRFAALRAVGPGLPVADGTLLSYARAMVLWHRRQGYCGVCGTATQSEEGGHVRRCPSCNAQFYPRTDPAVIMMVVDGDRIILHRQRSWAPGMWSCLAGFLEPGESLEEAVIREVREETGLVVTDVRYAASQPWPFPSSLMVAFTARAIGGDLVPALDEIEDARWFTRADLAAFDDRHRDAGGGLFFARPGTIARMLVDGWLSAAGLDERG